MRTTSLLLPASLGSALSAQQAESAGGSPGPGVAVGKSVVSFEAPVRLRADGELIHTESPGCATPAWFDIDGDGHRDLIVGQFADGRMKVYKGRGGMNLAKGEWLMADGEIAQVPGIW